MSSIIVFDLDGTLALDEHRVHHLLAEPKDWDSYFALCPLDTPHVGICAAYDAFSYGTMYQVEIWTGRIDKYREATEAWILQHLYYQPNRLLMRATDDRTHDHDLKRAWLHETHERGNEVILVFEDRKRVVEMWRAEGITCAQVAEGNF